MAKSLIYNENREKQLSEIEMAAIANIYNDEIENFIKFNPNFQVEDSEQRYYKIRAVSLKTGKNDSDLYVFDNKGLLEVTRTTKGEDIPGYKSTKLIKVKNVRNNIEQEALQGILENSDNEYLVILDTIKYFDKEHNLTKTMVCKQDNLKGTMNVSVNYPDGRNIPIQYMSIDPESGEIIAERNFTSPEGVKTRYYYEENDNLRISNYKIVDKNGKTLMDLNQTFQKVSENKFISSINGHSYEINFNENSLEILDKKTNITTKLDLDRLILALDNADRNKIIDILKQVPANQLLMMDRLPIDFISYNKYNTFNGQWDREYRQLEIGNFDKATDPENSYLALFTHEYGHFLDLAEDEKGVISNNPDVIRIAKEEFKELLKNTTLEQQKYIMYFTDQLNLGAENSAGTEGVAEANALANSVASSVRNTRRFYYQMYFPRRIAKIMELIHDKQGM